MTLEIEMANHPVRWRLVDEDYAEIVKNVIECAVFATMDSPVEAHILCVDRDEWVRTMREHPNIDVGTRDFVYQVSFVGYNVLAETRHRVQIEYNGKPVGEVRSIKVENARFDE